MLGNLGEGCYPSNPGRLVCVHLCGFNQRKDPETRSIQVNPVTLHPMLLFPSQWAVSGRPGSPSVLASVAWVQVLLRSLQTPGA